MLEDEYYAIAKSALSGNLMNTHSSLMSEGGSKTAHRYKAILARLNKDGHLRGSNDTWASDSFATAVQQCKYIPKDDDCELYSKLYFKMFGFHPYGNMLK